MYDAAKPLVGLLTEFVDELNLSWKIGVPPDGLTAALRGDLQGYDRGVDAIRAALAPKSADGPYTSSPQLGAPASCLLAQVFLHGMAVATFEPTTDPDVASRRARLCAEALNRAAAEEAA